MARFPSTQALRALECFSRHGTVWQTAEELNLTRSAISHQLRLLERDLGFRLLNRIGTSVKLTPQGAAYAADVRKALDAITGSAARNAGRGVSGALTVSSTPGFAASWLGPKIGRFRDACPDVELSIVTPRRLDDVTSPEVDVFIAFGTGNAPEMEVELLVEVEFTPLCSPTLLNRLGGLAAPSDVLRAGLLHLAHADDWRVWFNAAGLAEEAADTGIFFADMNLVYAAALHSQGIAMGDEFICRAAMETGQLVRPFDVAIPSPRSYFLMIAPEKTGNPVVAAFNDWIKGELRP